MSANGLLTFLAWTFIPSYATQFVHGLYYRLTIRAGDPKPQPGSLQYKEHYKRIYAILIIAYLCFTMLQSFHELHLESDFYAALGVPHDVEEKTLRSRYRRLAAQYHPDKVGDTGAAHDHYVFLQTASDTLLDPVKRFMYDRFGSGIVKAAVAMPKQAVLKDWMVVALYQTAPMYVTTACSLATLGFIGYLQYGRYWRWWAFATLLCLELWIGTRPYYPWIMYAVVNPLLISCTRYPPLLPFQFMALARKLTFNVFIAISQLGPILDTPGAQYALSRKEVELEQLGRLEQVVKGNEIETNRLLALNMAPFVGNEAVQRELKMSARDWLVQNTIRSDADVRAKITAAIERRHEMAD